MFDLSHLGAWRDLPFFTTVLPQIEAKLAQETRAILPPAAHVFAALQRTQPDDVNVVIFGQDPYPQPGKAEGIAFSIPDDYAKSARRDSLDNILGELHSDLGVQRRSTSLADWTDKGVLLFNCLALTVPEGKAGGHRSLGWKILTDQIIARLSDRPRAYLLWGGDAHKAAQSVDGTVNFKLQSSHPSPLGWKKTGANFEPFHGSKPFSRTNAWLRSTGHASINWGDPEGP
ncbi:uracil-DNA glycosylase [uncultured Sulfitobacter sp.]|uniref:uracil-DNA glycosylase n=1 Tax=uncultured Sulfitobacter sp. TaxID=191468 RepID=UPI00261BB9F4|nr:uracil-DNA glycosylase [uncultured Sulfitobacter sp.]